MTEYIARNAIYYLAFSIPNPKGPGRADVVDVDDVDSIPAADVVEVRHGRWKKSYADHEAFGVRPFFRYCSECHEATVHQYNYCPNCGAYMKGGDENG